MKLPSHSRALSRSLLSVGLLTVVAIACGKSDKKDDAGADKPADTPASKAALDPETATVTAASNTLQLASDLVLLPAKDGAVKLALRGSSDAKARGLRLHVSSDAFEALNSVSNIMCYFSQTKFWEQANKGKYKAFIDSAKCESDKGGDDDEEGGRPQELMEAFVEATREEGKPLKARVKFEMRGEEGSYETYQADITVAAPPSDENPAGLFAMYFNGYSDEALTKPTGNGFIRTKRAEGGKLLIEYADKSSNVEDGQTYKSVGSAIAILEKVGSDFAGSLKSDMANEFSHDGKAVKTRSVYNVRFDKNLMRVKGSAPNWDQGGDGQPKIQAVNQCFDRNKFRTFIWQYDLADAKGEVVALDSGFQIETTVGGKPVSGNAGYHGVWFPANAEVANGATVNKVTWVKGKKQLSPYTYVEGPGRLVKYTRNKVTLGQLKGADFSYWEQGMGPGDMGGQYIVRWNGSKLQKVAKMTQSMNGPGEEEALPTPIDLDPATFNDWGLRLRSNSLDAEVNFPQGVVLSDAFEIAYHSETNVTEAKDFPASNLLCFGACPKIAMQASELQMSNGGGMGGDQPMDGCPPVWSKANQTKSVEIPMGPQTKTCQSDSAPDLTTSANAIATFAWNPGALAISQDGTTFSLTADAGGSSPDGKEGGGGHYMSGPLFPQATYDALSTATKAKWPDQAAQDAEVFYRWQTGTDKWSRFAGLKGADGKLVTFDRPLDLAYTHTAANDFDGDAKNPGIGKLWRLNYGGPGQLWGIPFKNFDDVGSGGGLFSIAPGAKIGAYTVYPVRGEQRMRATAASACAKLDVDKLPDLPKFEDRKVKHTNLKGDLELRYTGGVAPDAP